LKLLILVVQKVSSPGNTTDDLQMNQPRRWYFLYRSDCLEANSQAEMVAGWTQAHLPRIVGFEMTEKKI